VSSVKIVLNWRFLLPALQLAKTPKTNMILARRPLYV
jgi:hypothetical protein